MLIFDLSRPGRGDGARTSDVDALDIPDRYLRGSAPFLPEVSALDALRHYTRLSRKNCSTDIHDAGNVFAMLPQFLERHPLSPADTEQGFLSCVYELQEILKRVTGMEAVSLTPLGGAQGKFAGMAMLRAYHESRGDHARNEVLVPDSACATNAASVAMCGYELRDIPTDGDGNVDLHVLKSVTGSRTAALMLTNPSSDGVFESGILEIEKIVHSAGALLYYDGANFNAILGKVKLRDMGFDAVCLNLRKILSTPHGGDGHLPSPVAVSEKLKDFLPIPIVALEKGGYVWLDETKRPHSIGRLSAFMGSAGALLGAYAYARMLGTKGLRQVSEVATLNANYLMVELQRIGYEVVFPKRRAGNKFVVRLKTLNEETGIDAMDIAKRLLDKGAHYFSVCVAQFSSERLLIEPTETESKQTLDTFVAAMKEILDEAKTQPDLLKQAPHTMPVKRLDEVKAARELDLVWKPLTRV
jgi:glycine dehydrogenase subunit 2